MRGRPCHPGPGGIVAPGPEPDVNQHDGPDGEPSHDLGGRPLSDARRTVGVPSLNAHRDRHPG